MTALKTMKEMRVGMRMTQQQTADALGVSLSTVHRIETGRMKASLDLHKRINELFNEAVVLHTGATKSRGRPGKNPDELEKVRLTENEKRFLNTCRNMQDALHAGRMIMRDIVDATYEFMDECEALTCLYKWSKLGFYHYPKGAVVDQGYFLWDKLPPKYRRIIDGE